MLKIAITGNIASGKSVVEKFLKDKGCHVFDADEMAHAILEKSAEVKIIFKDYDILTDGKIDRKKLAKIVFSDSAQMKKLESVIHPLVKQEILDIFNKNYDKVFISVPQLFEAGFEKLFDKIIYITADTNIRLNRLMKRNRISKDEATARINAQIPDAEKIKHCDIIIKNNESLDELIRLVSEILANQQIV